LEFLLTNNLRQNELLNSKLRTAEVNKNESIKKINDKYDLENKNNVLKNLKTDYDLITSSVILTEEEKYNLHTQNLYKQETATKVYYDELIAQAAGNKDLIAQLEIEKTQAVQAVVDKNWALYSDYYNKLNDELQYKFTSDLL
jgi:hypothetical protein